MRSALSSRVPTHNARKSNAKVDEHKEMLANQNKSNDDRRYTPGFAQEQPDDEDKKSPSHMSPNPCGTIERVGTDHVANAGCCDRTKNDHAARKKKAHASPPRVQGPTQSNTSTDEDEEPQASNSLKKLLRLRKQRIRR